MQYDRVAMQLPPYPYFEPIRCHSKTSPQYRGCWHCCLLHLCSPGAKGAGHSAKPWAQLGRIRNNSITTLVFFFSYGCGFVMWAEKTAADILAESHVQSNETKPSRLAPTVWLLPRGSILRSRRIRPAYPAKYIHG